MNSRPLLIYITLVGIDIDHTNNNNQSVLYWKQSIKPYI